MKPTTDFAKRFTTCLLLAVAFWVGQPSRAAQYTVEMTSDWRFSPNYLVIQVGDIVTWVNHDWTYNYHDSVCLPYWNTGLLDVDESASVPFPVTGTFNYRDSSWYVLGMTGTIVVNPATPTEPTPATLLNPMSVPGSGFQFTLSNLVVGATYVIQASTDVVNWTNLSTNIASSTVEIYLDTEATALPRRFYRSWHLP
jgi:plastocyanin